MISVRRESWNAIWPECNRLMEEHFNEVREDTITRPFKVDYEGAARLDEAGVMEVFAAREDDRLVGYLIWFVVPDFESAGNKMAAMGPFYSVEEAKGAGKMLWVAGLRRLRELGIKFATCHHSSFGPRQENAKRLFESSGGYQFEVKYALKLG